MRVVQAQRRHRGGGHHRAVVAASAVDQVLPHEHAEPVAVVVPAQRLDLDVLAQHREAEIPGGADVMGQRLVRRCGAEPVGPVALVEQPRVQVGLAVEQQPGPPLRVRPDPDRAHPDIAGHPVRAEEHLHVVQERVLRRPGPQPGPQPQARGHAEGYLGAREHPSVGAHGDRRRRRISRRRAHTGPHHSDLELAGLQVRGQLESVHPTRRDGLQPDGLPDAGMGGVPDATGGQGLLAPAAPGGVGHVSHPDDKLVPTRGGEGVGDVEGERQVAAAVCADVPAVHPDLAVLVDRAEVEKHPVADEAVGQGELTAVPQRLVRLQGAAHARQRRLG